MTNRAYAAGVVNVLSRFNAAVIEVLLPDLSVKMGQAFERSSRRGNIKKKAANGKIIRKMVFQDREYVLHATKGWRSRAA
jgi:hypothetical protein